MFNDLPMEESWRAKVVSWAVPITGRSPDDTILATPVGSMKLINYLPTRVLDLTIHTLDIAAAVGAQVQPPPGPMEITLHLLADLSVGRGSGPELAFALTGRGNLREGFSLLG